MKLTKQDVAYLKEQYHEDDANISQIRRSVIRIEQSANVYGTEPKRITHEEARQLLGDKRYLGAIDRCIFHRTAASPIDDSNHALFFENCSWRN